ncbi:unnamed protein product, partial [Allacma fusca]
MDYNRVM